MPNRDARPIKTATGTVSAKHSTVVEIMTAVIARSLVSSAELVKRSLVHHENTRRIDRVLMNRCFCTWSNFEAMVTKHGFSRPSTMPCCNAVNTSEKAVGVVIKPSRMTKKAKCYIIKVGEASA